LTLLGTAVMCRHWYYSAGES